MFPIITTRENNAKLTYPKIDDPNLKFTLWTCKQCLTLKIPVRYENSIHLLLTSVLGIFEIRFNLYFHHFYVKAILKAKPFYLLNTHNLLS